MCGDASSILDDRYTGLEGAEYRKIVRTVQEQIEDGAIILMHDEYDTSVEAALQVVDELKNQGYELVTVDQLILP